MSIMTIFRLILNMTGIDGNLSRFLFGSSIDIFITHSLAPSLLGEYLGDGLGEGSFAVIHMADGADVYVRFVAVEFVTGGGEGSAREAVQTRRRAWR